MLGTRGVRLGVLHPEIYEMQVRAIVRAARAVRERTGRPPKLEIMIPLVAYERELELVAARVVAVAEEEGLSLRSRLQRRDDDRAARVPASSPTGSPVTPTSSRSAPTTSPRPGSASRATTSRGGSSRATSRRRSSTARRSRRSTRRASGSSCASAVRAGAGRRRRPRAGRLRGARRRPRLDPLLPRRGARLRQLLPVPAADRPRGGRSGGDRGTAIAASPRMCPPIMPPSRGRSSDLSAVPCRGDGAATRR